MLSKTNARLFQIMRKSRNAVRSISYQSVVARFRFGRGPIALIDQALVSGSNFLTSIVLVRALGLSDFGKYSIAYAVILLANSLQASFITTPMLITVPLLDDKTKQRSLNGLLAMQLLASGILFTTCAIAGEILRIFTDYYSTVCILGLAGAIGTYQLQDWIRRYYFLTARGHLAIISDFISYFLQLALLAGLAWKNKLTLPITLWVMALTSAAAFLMGPITDRLQPSLSTLMEVWSKCKKLSKDLLFANQVRWFGDQGILLMGTWIVGVKGLGGLRATQSLAGPVNLVLTSLDNVLPMKIGELLKTKGTAGAYSYIRNMIVLSTVGLTLILVPVAIFGRTIIRAVYGAAVVPFYIPMILQLGNIVVGVATRLWFYFFRGVHDIEGVLRANALCAIIGVTALICFGKLWGASGVVLASLASYVAIVLYCMLRWSNKQVELLARYPGVVPTSTIHNC